MIEHFKSEKYEWLSNFKPCIIVLDGIEYSSVEHAYVSAKSDSIEWKEFCRTELNPAIIKKQGRELTLPSDWDVKKLVIMKLCIDQKYDQEPYRSKLIETGSEYIQEGNWWNDTYWGVCLKSTPPVGSNILGKLIMEKRTNLINDLLL